MKLTFFNHAGGVGKTSLARDFAYELAQVGKRVLLVDFDPQANLTSFLGQDKQALRLDQTLIPALLEDDLDKLPTLLPAVVETYGIHLYPTKLDLATAEVNLLMSLERERRLSRVLKFVEQGYDYVLVDSPPSLGSLTINALVAADKVISPVSTSYKALDGLSGLFKMVKQLRSVNAGLSFAGFVPTMFDQRNKHDHTILEALQEQLQKHGPILPTIRNRAAVHKDATLAGQPVSRHAPKSDAADDIRAVVREFLRS